MRVTDASDAATDSSETRRRRRDLPLSLLTPANTNAPTQPMKFDYSVHLPSPGYTLHLSRTISQILIGGVRGQQVVAVTH